MNIQPINLIRNNYQLKPNYGFKAANLGFDTVSFSSKSKQKLDEDMFFIDMNYYDRNSVWADSMMKSCKKVTTMVENKKDFDEIVDTCAKEVQKAYRIISMEEFKDYINNKNQDLRYLAIERFINKYGQLKDINSTVFFPFSMGRRGEEYFKLYKEEVKKHKGKDFYTKSNEEYNDAKTARISHCEYNTVKVYYGGGGKDSTKNLKVAKRAYDKLIQKENPTLDEIVETAATIQWLIAQATPFESGSDSIASLISKSILRAYDVKLSPIKKGKSFDFEAFYRNLDDYIKIYPSLFREKLEFITT